MARTQEELQRAFNTQRLFLRRSSEAYDAGDKAEGARLANAICILVYDSRTATSIMTQLGLRETTPFISTSSADLPGNRVPWSPLVRRRIIVSAHAPIAEYVPNMSSPLRPERPLAFSDWWEEMIFDAKSDGSERLTRKGLLLSIRNQDGGAHYDQETTDAVFNVVKDGAGHFLNTSGTLQAFGGMELASARQIAHEMELTLRHLPLQ